MKEKLRELMAAQNLNPEGLAVRLQQAGHKISYSSVTCWYYGRRTPDLPRAKALAEVLGVSLDELAAGIEIPAETTDAAV